MTGKGSWWSSHTNIAFSTTTTVNSGDHERWSLRTVGIAVGIANGGDKIMELEYGFRFARFSSFSTHIEPSTASCKNPTSPSANTRIPNASLHLTTVYAIPGNPSSTIILKTLKGCMTSSIEV